MRISNTMSSPSFKANFYKVSTSQGGYAFYQTDNVQKLGEKPVLCMASRHGDYREIAALKKDKKGLYTADCALIAGSKFKIKYEDTGNVDGPFCLSGDTIRKVTIYDKKVHKQPLIHFISENPSNGKLVIIDVKTREKKLEESNTPVILMCNTSEDFHYFTSVNKPPAGVIFMDTQISDLSHEAASLRNLTPLAVGLWDEDKIEELKQFENQYIKLTPNQNDLEVTKIDKSEIKPVIKIKKKVTIPELKPVDKLLSSDEYTKDNVGNKAYNLHVLEEMVKEEKIDVIIPKSFAVPYKYIDGLVEENEVLGSEKTSPRVEEIRKRINESNIGELYIVRSAFNGEDLDDYSAQGLYDSMLCREGHEYGAIMDVVNSKDSQRAVKSREEYGIKSEDIKPTVIIQQRIPADYTFTIYTKVKSNTLNESQELFIELSPKKNPFRESVSEPYIIKYNPETDKLNIESVARQDRFITVDENGNIVDEEPVKDEISKNIEKYWPILKAAAKNALLVEKELGKPQDIEGGILGDKIYFWQTRNIVMNAKGLTAG